MNNYDLCTATAKIHFSDIYWFEHHLYYIFDITFDDTSTLLFKNLTAICAGSERESAEDFLKVVKMYFASAGIHDGDRVSLLFSESEVLAIGAHGKDSWIDVREGVLPCKRSKAFHELDFKINSLKVY